MDKHLSTLRQFQNKNTAEFLRVLERHNIQTITQLYSIYNSVDKEKFLSTLSDSSGLSKDELNRLINEAAAESLTAEEISAIQTFVFKKGTGCNE